MELQPQEIQNKIYEIRGKRVMLDHDIAELYSVPTKALKQAVRRNIERFPDDFMFELTQEEFKELVTNCDHIMKHSYIPSLAFTQEGITMLSSVLRSSVAIRANINIMRAFVAVRQYILAHASASVEMAQLRERVFLLEQIVNNLSEEVQTGFNNVYTAIDELSNKPPHLPLHRLRIGFKPDTL